MPRGRPKKSLFKINWQESYGSFVLGAIIIIVLGLLVANFISKRNEKIDSGEQITKTEEEVQTSQTYKIKVGDSLSKIAEKNYGSQEYWPVLVRVNKIANPNLIYTNSELKIPSKTEAEKIKSQMAITSYKVKRGDTLFKIAENAYGDGSKWPILAKANRVGRLPNGNPLIFAGSTLVIPR